MGDGCGEFRGERGGERDACWKLGLGVEGASSSGSGSVESGRDGGEGSLSSRAVGSTVSDAKLLWVLMLWRDDDIIVAGVTSGADLVAGSKIKTIGLAVKLDDACSSIQANQE